MLRNEGTVGVMPEKSEICAKETDIEDARMRCKSGKRYDARGKRPWRQERRRERQERGKKKAERQEGSREGQLNLLWRRFNLPFLCLHKRACVLSERAETEFFGIVWLCVGLQESLLSCLVVIMVLSRCYHGVITVFS
jgi:hypothetical protein